MNTGESGEATPPRDSGGWLEGTDLRGLLQSIPNAMLVIDRAGTIVAANPQAMDLFGYAGSELIFKPLAHLIPGDSGRDWPRCSAFAAR
jgi:PAS domain S-box-containing protein